MELILCFNGFSFYNSWPIDLLYLCWGTVIFFCRLFMCTDWFDSSLLSKNKIKYV